MLSRLLSRQPAPLIGLDISSSSVKLVELGRDRHGNLVLERCATEPLERGWVADGNIEKFDQVAEAVRRLIRKSGTKVKDVAMALPPAAVITKKVVLPAGLNEKDLEVRKCKRCNGYHFRCSYSEDRSCRIGYNADSCYLHDGDTSRKQHGNRESHSCHHSNRTLSLISLIGLPGSGKTTVGRQVAKKLGLPFIDCDAVAEERLGCSIRVYFEQAGEERFRDLEESLIDELTQRGDGVLSTGGGAVLRPINRQRMRERTHVFYLRSTPEVLIHRLQRDTQRPLLQVADPLARLRELFTVRDPLYLETAHTVIETGRPSVQALVCQVLERWESLPHQG